MIHVPWGVNIAEMSRSIVMPSTRFTKKQKNKTYPRRREMLKCSLMLVVVIRLSIIL